MVKYANNVRGAGRRTTGVAGKLATAQVAVGLARKTGQVVRSARVQQAARDIAPAATRLARVVREEWARTR